MRRLKRIRVECNFGSKYFDDAKKARKYFYQCVAKQVFVEVWLVEYERYPKSKEYIARQELIAFYGYPAV